MKIEGPAVEYFMKWIDNALKPILDEDAETDVIGTYIITLLRIDEKEEQLRESCIAQLRDFLNDDTENFVNSLFDAIKKSPYRDSLPSSAALVSKYEANDLDDDGGGGSWRHRGRSRDESDNDSDEDRRGRRGSRRRYEDDEEQDYMNKRRRGGEHESDRYSAGGGRDRSRDIRYDERIPPSSAGEYDDRYARAASRRGGGRHDRADRTFHNMTRQDNHRHQGHQGHWNGDSGAHIANFRPPIPPVPHGYIGGGYHDGPEAGLPYSNQYHGEVYPMPPPAPPLPHGYTGIYPPYDTPHDVGYDMPVMQFPLANPQPPLPMHPTAPPLPQMPRTIAMVENRPPPPPRPPVGSNRFDGEDSIPFNGVPVPIGQDTHTVRCTNIPPFVTEKELFRHFKVFGRIASLRLIQNPRHGDGSGKKYYNDCYVQFVDSAQAKKSFSSPSAVVGNRYIKVLLSPQNILEPSAEAAAGDEGRRNDPKDRAKREVQRKYEELKKLRTQEENIMKKQEELLEGQIEQHMKILSKLQDVEDSDEKSKMSETLDSKIMLLQFKLREVRAKRETSKSNMDANSAPENIPAESSLAAGNMESASVTNSVARYSSQRGGRGGRVPASRGRHGGRSGGRGNMSIDCRTKIIKVSNIPDGFEDVADQHFARFGKVASLQRRDSDLEVTFSSRFEAEKAMKDAAGYGGSMLTLEWAEPVSISVTEQSAANGEN